MDALFFNDAMPEIKKLAEELRLYAAVDENLQNKIGRYVNLSAYQYYRSNHMYRDYINELYLKFNNYLDRSKEAFVSSFRDGFSQSIFELVMINLLNEKFSLKTRSSEEQKNNKSKPDFEFIINNKLYFMECTARYTTVMDKHLENKDTFNSYFQLAEIFSTAYEKIKTENPYTRGSWHRETAVSQTLDKLNDKEKYAVTELMQKLKIKTINDLIGGFNKWIEFYQELYWEFKNILSEEILKKIEKIIVPIFLVKQGLYGDGCLGFLIRSLAVKVLEKLQESYFKGKKPVVLAISLSALPNGIKNNAAMNQAANIGLDIGKLLLTELNNIIISRKFPKEKHQELSESLKHLYAILVDTSWYNWFPSILGAKFSKGYNNCYRIIYNQNLAQDIDFDHGIFDSLISPKYTSFLFFDLEETQAIEV